jgi:glutathione S-transferase
VGTNAILFYMADKRPDSGLWPSGLKGQADVLRWLAWEGAHWDAESIGMVFFGKGSKAVLGLGSPTPLSLRAASRTSLASRRY